MAHLKSLRKHLVNLLTEGEAHATFEDAVKDVPAAARGKVPEGAAHSLWDLVEHMRIAQGDILEFSRNAKHVSPKFPKGYWPKTSDSAECEGVGQEHQGVFWRIGTRCVS